jgi:Tfp pilus assembly protein PilN
MIEINLMPGTAKRTRRRAKLPLTLKKSGGSKKSGSGMAVDGPKMFVIASALVSIGAIAMLWLSASNRMKELDVAIEGAVRDSIRYATIIAANQELHDRQAKVAEKLNIIQEIDQARYVWAHVLDELSRALPAYTWLVSLSDISGEFGSKRPRLRIEGRAGHTFAMTQYMQNLESSPFLSGVTLINHQQIQEEGRNVYNFILEMSYSEGGPDNITTVPLFMNLEAN